MLEEALLLVQEKMHILITEIFPRLHGNPFLLKISSLWLEEIMEQGMAVQEAAVGEEELL